MENLEKKKVVNILASINKNTKKMVKRNEGLVGYDKSTRRDYLGSFSISGDEIPKELENVEHDEEYEMKVKVRISEVADDYGDEKKKRISLQIKKISSIDEITE